MLQRLESVPEGDEPVRQRCRRRGIIAFEPEGRWAGAWALEGEPPGRGAGRGPRLPGLRCSRSSHGRM